MKFSFKHAGIWGNTHSDRLADRIFTGHITIGPVTIYGANAMHWHVDVLIGRHYWCFHPTTRTYGGRWPWKFYVSPDGTPTRAVFGIGPGMRD